MGIDSSEIDEVPASSTKLTSMLKQRPTGSGANLSINASGTSSSGAGGTHGGGAFGGSGGGSASGGGSGPGSSGYPRLTSTGGSGDHRLGTSSGGGTASTSGHPPSGATVATPGTSGNSAKKEEKKGTHRKLESSFPLMKRFSRPTLFLTYLVRSLSYREAAMKGLWFDRLHLDL